MPFPPGLLHRDEDHRKVVEYVGFADEVEGEDASHDTHVAGSILGEVRREACSV